MKYSFFAGLLLSLFFISSSFAQLDQLKGMTQEELKQKAQQMGYTEEDLLKYQQAQQAAKQKEQGEQSGKTQQTIVVTPPAPPPSSNYTVSAFSGRGEASNLPAFGYNIFTLSPTTFEPSLNVPTPTNYVIGPGDEIIITLWGETQQTYDVTVSKNGDVMIPEAGLINVNGLSLDALKAKLFNRLSPLCSSSKTGSSTKFYNCLAYVFR